MKRAAYRRGQPVMTLAVVLVVWVSMRAATWDMTAQSVAESPGIIAAPARVAPVAGAGGLGEVVREGRGPSQSADGQHTLHSPPAPVANRLSNRSEAPRVDQMSGMAEPALLRGAPSVMPPSVPPPLPFVSPDATPRTRRWSADAWMMLRDGGASSPVTGPTRATYGASQLGAVLRYRLAVDGGHRPTAYLRGTAALIRPNDREMATGVSVRPIPGVPLTVAAEVRAGEINSMTRVRPAIMAVSELMPQKLPLGLLGEAYAQAGYVGGAGATAFVDGQLRIDRAVARVGGAELRLGAGAWGGAQKDASRFDLGPAANLGVSVNDAVFARVMVDWRIRVAGNAVPESGPALTLSAGF